MRVIDRDSRQASFDETQRAYMDMLNHNNISNLKNNVRFYKNGDIPEPGPSFEYDTQITINNEDVVERVFKESQSGYSVGVMNFASARHPGGAPGANAQEEVIVRRSFLLPTLNQCYNEYYKPNIEDNHDYMYTDDLIYSNNIPFVKRQTSKEFEDFVVPVTADVVSIAAPNRFAMLSHFIDSDDAKITNAITQRVYSTLRAFKYYHCDSIVLGAFGCGVFGNDPVKVAQIFHSVINLPEFQHAFKHITFSVFQAPTQIQQGKISNLKAFNQEFK